MTPDSKTDVDQMLKALRKQRNLSQRQLAQLAGMSHVTISLIERNRVSPQVATLKKLLAAMSVTMGEFFASSQPASRSKFFYRSDHFVEMAADSLVSIRQLGHDIPDRAMQIVHERYEPGGDTGKLMYSHEGEEGGVVIKGAIEMTVGDEVQVLRAGDGFYFKSNIPHRMRNVGDQVCEIVSAASPPTF